MRAIIIIMTLLLAATMAVAEDGELFVRNVSKTPDWETDHATLRVLYMNVPSSDSSGELVPIEYTDQEENVETLNYAQPMVAFYHDGPVEYPEDSGGFPGHGQRDVFGAVSLDDGNTWKRSNLSDSGFRSSFTLRDGTAYPGDTFRLFANSGGDKFLVAWASRYARGGNPLYAMPLEQKQAIADYIATVPGIDADLIFTQALVEDDEVTDDNFNMYFNDVWGVTGSQKSSDFADEGYPSVGEVPYACLYTCRATLEAVDSEGNPLARNADGSLRMDQAQYGVFFRQAERLTSGRRDVHRIEVGVAGGAGFVVTWQEDPDGLRPGEGEGPGEGWSGAVAHHETDVWYSFIDWKLFDAVLQDGADGQAVADYVSLYDFAGDGRPAVGVPMSMPVRISDNAMCTPVDENGDADEAYVYLDLDGSGTPDLCAGEITLTIQTPQGPESDVTLCLAEDGRMMRGNTGATRARVNLRGYDSEVDDDGKNDSAWVVMAYEESKGLGEEVDYDPGELIEKVDMGKNIWYHTFDMRNPETVSQGMILNQPAVYPEGYPLVDISERLNEYPAVTTDGHRYRFMDIDPDPIYEEYILDNGTTVDTGLESTLFQMEIARRFSLISQPGSDAGPSGTVALAMWKQGIIRQGGPADVYGRRFAIPEEYTDAAGITDAFDLATDNPFDYQCMVADPDDILFADGSNPRYVRGICTAPPLCMSGVSLVDDLTVSTSSRDGASNSLGATAEQLVDYFPFNEAFDDIDMGSLADDGLDSMPKIYEWAQYGPDYNDGEPVPFNITAIDDGYSADVENSFDDQSWENPYDVAKGHRGYIVGDYIMMLYCWSPNWLANTVGHDNYNLYVRRSFDGGQTWTTLPACQATPTFPH